MLCRKCTDMESSQERMNGKDILIGFRPPDNLGRKCFRCYSVKKKDEIRADCTVILKQGYSLIIDTIKLFV